MSCAALPLQLPLCTACILRPRAAFSLHPPCLREPMGCFAWTLEAGKSAGNGNSKGRLLSSRCFPGQAQEMAKPACGHYRCGQKAEGRGAKMPVLSPDGLSLTQRHPVRVLRAGEPIWEVHGQHQAAAQGTGLRVAAGHLPPLRGTGVRRPPCLLEKGFTLKHHIWEAGEEL